jgi:hypothetical protein
VRSNEVRKLAVNGNFLFTFHSLLLTGFTRVAAGGPYERHRVHRLQNDYNKGTISSATMLMILISGLMAGPAVSL